MNEYDNTPNYGNDLATNVKKYMNTYFKADESPYLTEDNRMLLAQVKNSIATLPDNSFVKQIINSEIDRHFAETKELGGNLNRVDELKQGPVRALVKREDTPRSSRAAFINVVILLYGILNIGIILAIAVMK